MSEQQPERDKRTPAERQHIKAGQAHSYAAAAWGHWEQTKDEAALQQAVELSAIANGLSLAMPRTQWLERNLPASDEAQHRKLLYYHSVSRIRARRQR